MNKCIVWLVALLLLSTYLVPPLAGTGLLLLIIIGFPLYLCWLVHLLFAAAQEYLDHR